MMEREFEKQDQSNTLSGEGTSNNIRNSETTGQIQTNENSVAQKNTVNMNQTETKIDSLKENEIQSSTAMGNSKEEEKIESDVTNRTSQINVNSNATEKDNTNATILVNEEQNKMMNTGIPTNTTQNPEPTYSFWAEQMAGAQGNNVQNNGINQVIGSSMQQTPIVNSIPMQEQKVYGYQEFQSNGTGQNIGKKKPVWRRPWFIVSVASIGAVVIGVGAYALVSIMSKNSTLVGEAGNSSNTGSTTTKIAETTVLSNSDAGDTVVKTVAKNVMPSIVSITSTVVTQDYFGQTYDQDGCGSGIIIKQSDDTLLVVTNYHVVEDAKTISVTFIDGKSVEATVKGTDSTADLAVISVPIKKIEDSTLGEIKVCQLGDSSNVEVGERVIAIGNALGYGQSVTVGYVSAKDREVEISGSKMTLLQTDAAINPGNSGGALLNANGEVIGINSAKLADSAVEGMGYAIPISSAVPIINDLMDREVLSNDEKGYLGISGWDVTDEEKEKYGFPTGVYVSEVSKDGAAAEAGIQEKDIITKINDIEVTSIQALAERVNSYRVGTKITITVQRLGESGYEEKEIKVTLKEKSTLNSLSGQEDEDSSDTDNSNNGNNSNNKNSYEDNSQSFPWDLFR